MIILDTNVASVLAASNHHDLPIVLAWQKASSDQDIRLSAITRAEMAFGIALLPAGARKEKLTASVEAFWNATADDIVAFGVEEADAYGTIMAARRSLGRPITILDAQIAATALVAGATLATRNVDDFVDCGIRLVNPYDFMPA